MRIEKELMRGAGPVVVLKALQQREMYGYELVELLARRSEGALAMGESTLYPLLYNLEAKGLIEGLWRCAQSGRERKYYRLTKKGRARLIESCKQWETLVRTMQAIGVVPESGATRWATT
jgi:PadR family transcriptional regulator PadR